MSGGQRQALTVLMATGPATAAPTAPPRSTPQRRQVIQLASGPS
jgi:hypothetical protein